MPVAVRPKNWGQMSAQQKKEWADAQQAGGQSAGAQQPAAGDQGGRSAHPQQPQQPGGQHQGAGVGPQPALGPAGNYDPNNADRGQEYDHGKEPLAQPMAEMGRGFAQLLAGVDAKRWFALLLRSIADQMDAG